jgi:hypothetical protein
VPGTRFLHALDRDGEPRNWTPPVPVEELIDTCYFGPALAAMEQELRIGGLTFLPDLRHGGPAELR